MPIRQDSQFVHLSLCLPRAPTGTKVDDNIWIKPDLGQGEDLRFSMALQRVGGKLGDTHDATDGRHSVRLHIAILRFQSNHKGYLKGT